MISPSLTPIVTASVLDVAPNFEMIELAQVVDELTCCFVGGDESRPHPL